MRAVLGIIGGLVAGIVAIIVVGMIGVGATFSPPPGMDPADPRQVMEAFAAMPIATQLAMMAAWLAGGLAGALVAKLIARSGLIAWIVAGLIALYVLLNVLVLPLPAWMQALWIAAPLIGGFIGNHLVRAAAATSADPLDGEGSSVGNG
jgi:hypothetical protein